MTRKQARIGSSFDDFLKQEGLHQEVTARAIKRAIARQLDALMHDQGSSRSSLAKRMKTSRARFDRLLDPARGLDIGPKTPILKEAETPSILRGPDGPANQP